MGQEESELCATSHFGHEGAEREDSEGAASQEYSRPGGRASPGNQSSRRLEAGRASIASCPEMAGQREDKSLKKGSTKGSRKGMSRRRVSCRELGRADCDGWLWKKKKDSSVFVAQKWQRFWFVLKGPSLYWYTSQQEEKADGLVKICSYSIESAGEHKRKFVFKMCHQRFQNFFFAADNVNDMSKWINCLINAIQKYKKSDKSAPDSEEECCSETEPEDEGSPHSPRMIHSHTLPKTRGRKNKEPTGSAAVSPTTEGSKPPGTTEDEMGVLFHRLKEDGVSPIGHEQPITHAQFRKSFIRRNKNPVINEKIHTLRALQSTLKAKEVELQLINKVLEDSALTSLKYRQWKEGNEHLLQEIERLAAERARGEGGGLQSSTTESDKVSTETGATETVAAETLAPDDTAVGLRLSYGEELVDAEVSEPRDPGGIAVSLEPSETERQQLNGRTQSLASAGMDNYFFI